MAKNVYLLTSESDRAVEPADRHALKDFVGDYLRVTHGISSEVAIDHLDADEPTVQALVVS